MGPRRLLMKIGRIGSGLQLSMLHDPALSQLAGAIVDSDLRAVHFTLGPLGVDQAGSGGSGQVRSSYLTIVTCHANLLP